MARCSRLALERASTRAGRTRGFENLQFTSSSASVAIFTLSRIDDVSSEEGSSPLRRHRRLRPS